MKDEEVVEVLKRENAEFMRLYQEHKDLDGQLTELTRKHYLTPEEEVEEKRIKKEKLQRKDRIAELVREYKRVHSLN